MGKKKRNSSGKSQDTKSEQGKSWLLTEQVKPPEPLNFQDSNGWKSWIKRYKMFHSGVALSSASEERQINMLLYCMGEEAEPLLTSMGMTEDKRLSFNTVVAAFEDYFAMRKNEFYHRALFLGRDQKPGEKVDSFIDDLQKLSEKCNWSCKTCKSKGFVEEMMVLKLVNGLADKDVSKSILREGATSLTEAKKILRLKESDARGRENASVYDLSEDFNLMATGNKVGCTGAKKKELYKSVATSSKKEPSSLHFTEDERPKSLYLNTERVNKKLSFSSGVDSGDEYSTDEFSSDTIYFFLEEKEGSIVFRTKDQKGNLILKGKSICDAKQLVTQSNNGCECTVHNCQHLTSKRETAPKTSTKLVTAGSSGSNTMRQSQTFPNQAVPPTHINRGEPEMPGWSVSESMRLNQQKQASNFNTATTFNTANILSVDSFPPLRPEKSRRKIRQRSLPSMQYETYEEFDSDDEKANNIVNIIHSNSYVCLSLR
ncbi:uncharacterized protein LOC128985318 [Macrosteles quadrilineatus]|uniref:uncharacterized protein LOC128985318 n=1 Tax=Macrosteles quadrilineatus TaxID=74068 RepID=UPI0023E1A876|nr:uncharacterized protein LOC128985318 [Macrosteles quadrilineatus]